MAYGSNMNSDVVESSGDQSASRRQNSQNTNTPSLSAWYGTEGLTVGGASQQQQNEFNDSIPPGTEYSSNQDSQTPLFQPQEESQIESQYDPNEVQQTLETDEYGDIVPPGTVPNTSSPKETADSQNPLVPSYSTVANSSQLSQ